MKIRVGTRASTLATTQSSGVAQRLRDITGLAVELVEIRTEGDVRTGSLASLGGTGVFVIPAVPYLQALGLGKDDLVQALGLSFTVSTIALAVGLGARGVFQLDDLALSALAVLPALGGMWAGQVVRNRISPVTFRRGFLVCLLLLGVEMSLRSLL